ncbi:MAG: DUF2797 domain-containing protein [Candidatus Sericytochromatia bacterium]|nr:DUF2797 domain-containing protein [Candidatus Sericytochromatia bacterium]
MQKLAQGQISKMKTELQSPVQYYLAMGTQRLAMNPLIGRELLLAYTSEIHCIHCGRATKKSFAQGYCYPCMTSLAQCDSCIMSPEKCHYAAGTCREPNWAQIHCMVDHIVYLSNASGLKVGLTRATQVPTRWIDQGAVQAIPMLRVRTRHLAGLAEVLFKAEVSDRTNWRKMLKNEVEDLDLPAERARLLQQLEARWRALDPDQTGAVQPLEDAPVSIDYPVSQYPATVSSFNLDKNPEARGRLLGIKGQYLIFDTGVINLRKYTGYQLAIYAAD